MTYQKAPFLMTLSELRRHSPITGLFKIKCGLQLWIFQLAQSLACPSHSTSALPLTHSRCLSYPSFLLSVTSFAALSATSAVWHFQSVLILLTFTFGIFNRLERHCGRGMGRVSPLHEPVERRKLPQRGAGGTLAGRKWIWSNSHLIYKLWRLVLSFNWFWKKW